VISDTRAGTAGNARSAAARSDRPVRARVAVTIAFISNGFIFGTWAARIPEIKDHLGLSSIGLGFALLAPAVGSLLAIRVVGRVSTRYGTGPTMRVTTIACLAIAWLPGIAPNVATIWVALLAWGATIGGMDVAMNAQGVTVEAAYQRPVLSGFHAAWSIGTFSGALIGGLGYSLGIAIGLQQAVLGAVLIAVALFADRAVLADPPATDAVTSPRRSRRRLLPRRLLPRRPDGRLALLGIAAIFAMICEGAVADWSGVLLRTHLNASPGQAGFGFAAFGIAMTAGRLAGDRLVHRFGRSRCVTTLAIIGATGLASGFAIDSLVSVIAGFAVLGIGLSVMVPVFFSSAADGGVASGPAIAVVASFGYTGFLIGPTVIGFIAQGQSVLFALRLLPVFTLIAGGLGLVAIRRAPPQSQPQPIGDVE
jgi:MFS family permease